MNWWNPGQLNDYEKGLKQFIEGLYSSAEFQASFRPFAAKVAEAGRVIATSELVLRVTTPGMADIYQGEDLWLWHLLDPHNRRKVDWAERQRILSEFQAGGHPSLETVKLWILWKLLNFRKANEDAFMAPNSYVPLPSDKDVVGFERTGACQVYIGLKPGVALPQAPEGWHNLLQDATNLGLPIAVYVRS